RRPFDAALLLQHFCAPHSMRQLHEALRSLGFRVGEGRLEKASFPCIAFPKGEASRPAIVLKSDGRQLLCFEAGGRAPVSFPLDTFDGDALFVAHELSFEDGTARAARFGWPWFWNEIAKHKRIWRDVLLASLFIQLLALATPLFTQVVIDKVVVHQTTNTLVVIAIGLAMCVVFNSGMSWLRQYLVLHTGNRVDAVLGSRVFRHLLRLP